MALGGGSHYNFAPELKELKPYVADASLGHLPHGDADDAGAAHELPDLQHAARPRAGDQGHADGMCCDTASNHSLDQGQSGIDDTGKALDSDGIAHTGSFPSSRAQQHDVVMKNVQGVKVAFLAYTTDTNGIPLPHPWSVNIASPKRILDDARKAHEAGRAGGDREHPLGRRDPGRVPADSEPGPARRWSRSSPSHR